MDKEVFKNWLYALLQNQDQLRISLESSDHQIYWKATGKIELINSLLFQLDKGYFNTKEANNDAQTE